MSIFGKKNESAEVIKAREKAELAKIEASIIKERAKVDRMAADTDARRAKTERYRAVTKTREKNGGTGVTFSSVPDLPPVRKVRGRAGGAKAPTKASKPARSASKKPVKAPTSRGRRK